MACGSRFFDDEGDFDSEVVQECASCMGAAEGGEAMGGVCVGGAAGQGWGERGSWEWFGYGWISRFHMGGVCCVEN